MLALVSTLVLTTGCDKPEPPQAAGPPYNTDIPLNEVMTHVVNPAAYQFWSGWGVVDDESGSRDLTPKTDEAWKVVEDGAATVVLATTRSWRPATPAPRRRSGTSLPRR